MRDEEKPNVAPPASEDRITPAMGVRTATKLGPYWAAGLAPYELVLNENPRISRGFVE
jgi:hypothetical protein